jgi:hypothetical protein
MSGILLFAAPRVKDDKSSLLFNPEIPERDPEDPEKPFLFLKLRTR